MGIALGGKDTGWLTVFFKGLASGGAIKMPLSRQPSGAEWAGSPTSSASTG